MNNQVKQELLASIETLTDHIGENTDIPRRSSVVSSADFPQNISMRSESMSKKIPLVRKHTKYGRHSRVQRVEQRFENRDMRVRLLIQYLVFQNFHSENPQYYCCIDPALNKPSFTTYSCCEEPQVPFITLSSQERNNLFLEANNVHYSNQPTDVELQFAEDMIQATLTKLQNS